MKFSVGIFVLLALVAISSAQFFDSASSFESEEDLALAESKESSEDFDPWAETQPQHQTQQKKPPVFAQIVCAQVGPKGRCMKKAKYFGFIHKNGEITSYSKKLTLKRIIKPKPDAQNH